MTYSNAIKSYFKRFLDFKGRSTRSEFWWPIITIYIITFVTVLSVSAISSPEPWSNLILLLWVVINILPAVAISVRRLHDMNATGWWYLLNFVFFGGVILLIWFCYSGTVGDNKYGKDPHQKMSFYDLRIGNLVP